MRSEQKLGEILVRLKVLSRFDLDRVLEAMRHLDRRQKFGHTARAMGLITEEHILAALTDERALDSSDVALSRGGSGLVPSTPMGTGPVPGARGPWPVALHEPLSDAGRESSN
jgi:hypothetical protein